MRLPKNERLVLRITSNHVSHKEGSTSVRAHARCTMQRSINGQMPPQLFRLSRKAQLLCCTGNRSDPSAASASIVARHQRGSFQQLGRHDREHQREQCQQLQTSHGTCVNAANHRRCCVQHGTRTATSEGSGIAAYIDGLASLTLLITHW